MKTQQSKDKYSVWMHYAIAIIIILVMVYCLPCVDPDRFGTAADWGAAIGGTAAVFIAIAE